MLTRRHWLTFAALAIVLATFLGVAFLTRTIWLTEIGRLLLRDDPPRKADLIIVLGGDFSGSRVMKACEVVSRSYAPLVLVSGGVEFYRINEADLAIRFATERGCPPEKLFAYRKIALSTTEEARGILPELRRRGVHSVIVVTSNYHTARAARICQSVFGKEIEVRTAAAPDAWFGPDRWWKTREGQKTAFYEYTKSIAAAIGM